MEGRESDGRFHLGCGHWSMRLWFLSCSYFSVLWRCVLVTYAVKDYCSIPRRIIAVSPDGPKMPKHALPKEACVWVEHILHTRSFHRVCKLCKDIRKYYMIESRTIWTNIVKYDTVWYNITQYDDMWHHMTLRPLGYPGASFIPRSIA
jgi:hypothetical protein